MNPKIIFLDKISLILLVFLYFAVKYELPKPVTFSNRYLWS